MILLLRSPMLLLGKNRNPRQHYALHRHKKAWGEMAAWAWKEQRRHLEPLDPARRPHTVTMALPMQRPRRADPHNYTSYEVAWIIDGLKSVGVFEDDTAEHVTVADPILYQRTDRPISPLVVAIDEPVPARLETHYGTWELR